MLASSLDVVVTCDVSKCLCIGKHIVHYMYVCPGSSVLRQRLLACAVLLNPSELASLQVFSNHTYKHLLVSISSRFKT